MVKDMAYLGIDPGMGGGLACLDDSPIAILRPMPDTDKDILTWLDNVIRGPGGDRETAFAILEAVNLGFPGSAKSALGKLSVNYGAMRMALTALNIPFEVVAAHKWQKAMGIPTKKPTESRTEWKNR